MAKAIAIVSILISWLGVFFGIGSALAILVAMAFGHEPKAAIHGLVVLYGITALAFAIACVAKVVAGHG